jgi:nucleotidyltransferase/DNA polymerase involved in DNA repair
MLFIGKSSANLLRKHGINTIADIANAKNQALLEELLDKN